jgi:hypothetical protein
LFLGLLDIREQWQRLGLDDVVLILVFVAERVPTSFNDRRNRAIYSKRLSDHATQFLWRASFRQGWLVGAVQRLSKHASYEAK